MGDTRTNWAGNIAYSTDRVHTPTSVEELQKLVAAGKRFRALGTGHSFNEIADTTGDLVSVAKLPPVIDVDAEARTVTVAAGLRYGDLCSKLDKAGLALPNLGSLPHISVAGACATATHGSGDANGSLATAVSALELVTADGSILRLSRADDPDTFPGAVVGLGALGVVTSLTLDVVPTFEVRHDSYVDLPFDQFVEHVDEIFAAGYSVSAFTGWTGPSVAQVWIKRRVNDDGWAPEPTWFGGTLATSPSHPVPGLSAEHCTEQLGVPGPWHSRLPHFALDFTPSSGAELQSEYLVPRAHTVAAIKAIREIGAHLGPALQVSEIRTVAADDLWMSPSYEQDVAAFHFTWIDDTDAVLQLLPVLEQQLAPFAARPHWGKLFATGPEELPALFPRLTDFQELRSLFDPEGVFGNDFLDYYLPMA